ncbi:MAG: FxsA family protein [Bacteroidetes bacterium]|nr:MAG: FxsA family protein [Bacteroidota bacterium]
MSRLLALFIIVPAVELYLLIQIGAMIGALETFGIILITGLIGSYLAKTQGLATLIKFQKKLASGQLPGKELADGVIILVSGAFLLTPGVLTDAVGLLGLFPLTRPMIRKWIQPWLTALLSSKFAQGSMQFRTSTNNGFYDSRTATETTASISPSEQDSTGSIVSGKARERPRHEG